jgi:aspartate/methionine/tyrosine aminotransferase
MEMGNPGYHRFSWCRSAIEALKRGVACEYPDIQGITPLKKEISRFLKLFINIDVDPQYVLLL